LEINWTESFLYGIISGITEFLPISSKAHQNILYQLFGITQPDSLMSLAVTLGTLLALVMSVSSVIRRIRREYALSRIPAKRRKRPLDKQTLFDRKFLVTACIPMLLWLIFYGKIQSISAMMPVNAIFLVLNGAILLIPGYLPRGNKDSRTMTLLDSVLFGICGGLGFLPGVSRIGAASSAVIARGADPEQAFKWSLLLSIPALGAILCFDGYAAVSAGLAGMDMSYFLKCVAAGVCAFLAGNFAIGVMRNLASRSGFTGFSYYCWGAALFSFIIYLY